MAANAGAHPDYPMWSALLRWSLRQGDDGTAPSPQGPMSDEKRRFLEAALKSMGEDDADRQRKLFEAVEAHVARGEDPDACVDALEQLEDDALDLDAARNLLKLGALGLVVRAVASGDGAVSAAACGVVAAACANDAEVPRPAPNVPAPSRCLEPWTRDVWSRGSSAGRVAAPPRGATWIFRGRPTARDRRPPTIERKL